jgi:hypothetical protein
MTEAETYDYARLLELLESEQYPQQQAELLIRRAFQGGSSVFSSMSGRKFTITCDADSVATRQTRTYFVRPQVNTPAGEPEPGVYKYADMIRLLIDSGQDAAGAGRIADMAWPGTTSFLSKSGKKYLLTGLQYEFAPLVADRQYTVRASEPDAPVKEAGTLTAEEAVKAIRAAGRWKQSGAADYQGAVEALFRMIIEHDGPFTAAQIRNVINQRVPGQRRVIHALTAGNRGSDWPLHDALRIVRRPEVKLQWNTEPGAGDHQLEVKKGPWTISFQVTAPQ